MDGKNREKKSDRTRQRLAAAAIAAMTERGYQGVTIRDICERAGGIHRVVLPVFRYEVGCAAGNV